MNFFLQMTQMSWYRRKNHCIFQRKTNLMLHFIINCVKWWRDVANTRARKVQRPTGDIKAETESIRSPTGRQNKRRKPRAKSSSPRRRGEETISLIKTSIMRNNLTASLATACHSLISRRHLAFAFDWVAKMAWPSRGVIVVARRIDWTGPRDGMLWIEWYGIRVDWIGSERSGSGLSAQLQWPW